MRRSVIRFCIVLILLPVCAAQDIQTLTIQAIMVDKDLNQKPIPGLAIAIHDSAGALVSEVRTGLDGKAKISLAGGKYTISTTEPFDFQGKAFTWKVPAEIGWHSLEITLSNLNAVVSDHPVKRVRATDELTHFFRKYQNSVLTVWSEFGHGTGFIIDESGLILTNQHVLGPAEYIAVQFDSTRKVRAVVLAKDAPKDIAVLWADLSNFPGAIPAPLSKVGDVPVEEGERVFTIGSPLSQRKILTTGIASKVEKRAIVSDININPGNSGGPLFNSIGQVVGLTTFGVGDPKAGPGISGIVRIEEALPLIESAKTEKGKREKPAATLLPVEPPGDFPIEAIKEAATVEKFDPKPYRMDIGKFDVTLITPILRYRYLASEVRAAKEKEKRTKKSKDAVKGTFQPLEDLRNWAEYAGEYKPVLMIRATPELGETTGSLFLRALVSPYIPAKIRFKADFYRMRLFCGAAEVAPIHPSKIAHVIDLQNQFVNATDASYEGFYIYPHDAIGVQCGQVRLQLFTEKEPNKAHERILDTKSLNRISADFQPYTSRGRSQSQ